MLKAGLSNIVLEEQLPQVEAMQVRAELADIIPEDSSLITNLLKRAGNEELVTEKLKAAVAANIQPPSYTANNNNNISTTLNAAATNPIKTEQLSKIAELNKHATAAANDNINKIDMTKLEEYAAKNTSAKTATDPISELNQQTLDTPNQAASADEKDYAALCNAIDNNNTANPEMERLNAAVADITQKWTDAQATVTNLQAQIKACQQAIDAGAKVDTNTAKKAELETNLTEAQKILTDLECQKTKLEEERKSLSA